ncbi:hypothetical protein ACFQYP_07745 [Nonomuraea antimicrobica]
MTVTAVQGIGAQVRAVTPTAARAQADFRALLNVLSRPGVLDAVGSGDGPAALSVAAGLADVEVPTAVLTAPGRSTGPGPCTWRPPRRWPRLGRRAWWSRCAPRRPPRSPGCPGATPCTPSTARA